MRELQFSSSDVAFATGTGSPSFRRSAPDASLAKQKPTKNYELRKAGLDTQASMVDDVVFGRNMDGASNETAPPDVRQARAFRDAYGRTSQQLHAHDTADYIMHKRTLGRIPDAHESARNIFGGDWTIARRLGRLHD